MAVAALALTIRVYQLKDLPAGLFCDEAAIGYNAYAIATRGIDENGKSFPLFIWSFGGYKNPIYIYAATIPIALLGLDEFTTRLPAALFGVGTVIGIFYLGRALFSPWVGLFAAVFLALCPWHIHFSRIAFELISFPFLFVIAFTLLVRFTQGRRTLIPALFLFGVCLYAYAIAAVFVPLFLIGFGLLYLPTLWRRLGETVLALAVIAATVAPAAYFYNRNQAAGTNYFRNTTYLATTEGRWQQLDRFREHYQEFFSPAFLFQRGDPLTRHAVRGFGELHPFYLPFLLLGAVAAALRRDRASKLLLWWLALYPVGASLMTEIPSATRGFIGAPAFCLLTALGFAVPLQLLSWLFGRWRPLAVGLQTAAVAVAAYYFVPDVVRYLNAYYVDYPKYSAPTPGGFQYGYREAIEFMERERSRYGLLMLTTTDANQPYIFALFYTRMDPTVYRRHRDPGYLVLDPAEYSRYSVDRGLLYAVVEEDLQYFGDYRVERQVVAPGGQVALVVVSVAARKQFLTNWMGLGLFDNQNGKGVMQDFIDVHRLSRDRYQGLYGDIYWSRISQQFVRLDLNAFYALSDRRHRGNPEFVCAYAVTTIRSAKPVPAFVEFGGSGDPAVVWFNGRALTPWSIILGEKLNRYPIDLVAGENVLLVKSCETIGNWFLTARIVDAQGRDVPGLQARAEFPLKPLPVPAAVGDAVQLVEGFASNLGFRHTQKRYADYRGGTESWWVYVRDPEGEVAWLTAPIPRKEVTAVAFTASVGEEPGGMDLLVNGKYALTFDTGVELRYEVWRFGGYEMAFVSKQLVAGNSGLYVLKVPAEVIVPGRPLELRVRPARGHDNAWFMLKNYTDTISHEYLTAERAAAILAGSAPPPTMP